MQHIIHQYSRVPYLDTCTNDRKRLFHRNPIQASKEFSAKVVQLYRNKNNEKNWSELNDGQLFLSHKKGPSETKPCHDSLK